jgi:N-acetylneuraminic acid mutarotase
MRKISFVTLGLVGFLAIANGQASWVQKADIGGQGRCAAIGFATDSFCYIGTGELLGETAANDFWRWDPATNTWTKMSNFPGGVRAGAIAFSIGKKGYVGGGGDDQSWVQDFWEYNTGNDTWTQKANLGGGPRGGGVGFSIGAKGYIVTGGNGASLQDFWEWNQATNVWTQRSNFPGAVRGHAAAFSIGNKGYVIGGHGDNSLPDVWEWNQATDTWTRKSDFGGGGRSGLVAFAIGGKGYAGTGTGTASGINCYQDFWEWDPITDKWTQIISFGGLPRAAAVGFAVGNRAYIGMGTQYGPYANFPKEKDFWEFSIPVTTGIYSTQVLSDLNIFPNPSSGKFTVTTTQLPVKSKICVYDVFGQCVLNKIQVENSQDLDLTGYAKGLYFLEVTAGDEKVARKIVVE